MGGAGPPSFGRLCLQERVPPGHRARPVKEEPGPWHRVCLSGTATVHETQDKAILAAPALTSPHLALFLETENE